MSMKDMKDMSKMMSIKDKVKAKVKDKIKAKLAEKMKMKMKKGAC